MFSFANILLFILGLVGCLLPAMIANYMNNKTAFLGVFFMFGISAIGAYVVSFVTPHIDSGTIFTRFFLTIGISQIIVSLGKLELYRRLELQHLYTRVDQGVKLPVAEQGK